MDIVKLNWPRSFHRQKPFPLQDNELFNSLETAEIYALSGKTSYIGQIVTVVDEVSSAVTVYKINFDRTLSILGEGDVDAEEVKTIIENVLAGKNYTTLEEVSELVKQEIDNSKFVTAEEFSGLTSEFVTKAEIPCSVVTVTEIYDDMQQALDKIRNSANNLVIIEAIDRIPFDYRYLLTLLYYNLIADFDYIINEIELNELPYAEPVTVVTPSTITDVLATGELVDKSYIPYIKFVGIDLGDLPETHVSSGMVLGKLFDSLLQENGIECPVLTISSLRLGNTAYDLGSIISGGVNK